MPLHPGVYNLYSTSFEDGTTDSFTIISGVTSITNSTVKGGNWSDGAVWGYNIVAKGLNITGGQHSFHCADNCTVTDSWLHDQYNPAGGSYHNNAFITNGGYGTVNMAISHGVPIISAGLTEDKEEVSAHVQWSGAGIDLRTNRATPEAIEHAVDEIFAKRSYRERAQQLSLEFASHAVEAELLSLIEECVPETVPA